MKNYFITVLYLICQSSFANSEINQIDDSLNELIVQITNPVHSELLPFDYNYSSEDGICKLFGFNRSVRGTKIGVVHSGPSVIVDYKGKITYGSKDYPIIKKIFCIKK